MDKYIKSFYDEAAFLGMRPYEFDTHIARRDVFNRKNGHISGLNKWKYMLEAKNFLKETKEFKMKFGIISTAGFYNDKEVEPLKKLGLVMELNTCNDEYYIKEDSTIEIKDLDELMKFCKQSGGRLVIQISPMGFDEYKDMPVIEIYNDWRE